MKSIHRDSLLFSFTRSTMIRKGRNFWTISLISCRNAVSLPKVWYHHALTNGMQHDDHVQPHTMTRTRNIFQYILISYDSRYRRIRSRGANTDAFRSIVQGLFVVRPRMPRAVTRGVHQSSPRICLHRRGEDVLRSLGKRSRSVRAYDPLRNPAIPRAARGVGGGGDASRIPTTTNLRI